jgi:hypothetical protein
VSKSSTIARRRLTPPLPRRRRPACPAAAAPAEPLEPRLRSLDVAVAWLGVGRTAPAEPAGCARSPPCSSAAVQCGWAAGRCVREEGKGGGQAGDDQEQPCKSGGHTGCQAAQQSSSCCHINGPGHKPQSSKLTRSAAPAATHQRALGQASSRPAVVEPYRHPHPPGLLPPTLRPPTLRPSQTTHPHPAQAASRGRPCRKGRGGRGAAGRKVLQVSQRLEDGWHYL